MNRLLQVVLALVGIAITGVLGFASQRSESLQARHTLMANFTQTITAARTACDKSLATMADGALGQLDILERRQRFLPTKADELDQKDTQRLLGVYRDILEEVRGDIDSGNCRSVMAPAQAPGATGGVVAGLAPGVVAAPAPTARAAAGAPLAAAPVAVAVKAAANTDLRRSEAMAVRERSPEQRAQGLAFEGYYVVLGSYAVDARTSYQNDTGVAADYKRLRALIPTGVAPLQVFQTSISNHYAIVLAPEGLTREAARELVSTARARAWATDAFVQGRRNWTQCEQPELISEARPCRRALTQ